MSAFTYPRSEQTYWERRYEEWWDRPYHGMSQNTDMFMAAEEAGIASKLLLLLRPHHRVLDAGCGYGRIAPMICPRVREYVGVDFSRKAIEAARCRPLTNARFISGDMLDITGEFDVVVMCGVWSSIAARSDLVIDHLRSLLAPDGVIAVFEYGSDRVIGKDGTVEWLA